MYLNCKFSKFNDNAIISDLKTIDLVLIQLYTGGL